MTTKKTTLEIFFTAVVTVLIITGYRYYKQGMLTDTNLITSLIAIPVLTLVGIGFNKFWHSK